MKWRFREAAASLALERCDLPEAPNGMAIAEARLRSAVLWSKEGHGISKKMRSTSRLGGAT